MAIVLQVSHDVCFNPLLEYGTTKAGFSRESWSRFCSTIHCGIQVNFNTISPLNCVFPGCYSQFTAVTNTIITYVHMQYVCAYKTCCYKEAVIIFNSAVVRRLNST